MSAQNRIYMDYNATSPLRPEARAAIEDALDTWGNPSSAYAEGREARARLETARGQMAEALGTEPARIIFTSGGTESDNAAIRGVCETPGRHVVTSTIEHPAVMETCRGLERSGVDVTHVPCDSRGWIDPKDVEAAITPATALVSIMHANNEIGTIQDIRDIAGRCHAHNVPFHCDAVQSIGRIPLSLQDGPDLMSLSAHKLGGPKGVGILYFNPERVPELTPFIVGGEQERSHRAGTESVLAAMGCAAATLATMQAVAEEERRLQALRDDLWQRLASLPGVHLNGDLDLCLPNTLSVAFDGVDGNDLMIRLDLDGIAVSSGAACATGAQHASHVLHAIYPDQTPPSPIRISLGYDTTDAAIPVVAQSIGHAIQALRDS